MDKGLRRVAVVALAVGALLGPANPAQAAETSQVEVAALPSYDTWLADVTAVAGNAERYLDARLPAAGVRAAIVLDIDNTALVEEYSSDPVFYPATAPILEIAQQAKADGAAVFFVTARPEIIYLWTQHNLGEVGYPIDGLYTRATFDFSSNETMKTNARIAIERRGYTIVANIGNNTSDLNGGHAERTFKLPDYNGQLS
ncbi:HAD family acid phosphatase [Actinomycetes bacterium KLBMP 9797]